MTLLKNTILKIMKRIYTESGTTSIWHYKKFADGTCECYGRYYVASGVNWADYVTNLTYTIIKNLSFPFAIYDAIPVVVCEKAADNLGWVASVTHTDTDVSMQVIKNSGGTNTDLSLNIQIKGRWK